MAKRRGKELTTNREEEKIKQALTAVKRSETRTMRLKKKERFITFLNESLCNISQACKMAGIHRRTFYNWLDTDQEFAIKVNEAREQVLDKLEETALRKAIDKQDTTMLIFLLKTQAKQRGYVEGPRQVNVEVTNKQRFKLGDTELEF